jgi:uroporphyrinogen III methyltransferase / synthase
MAPGKVWLVGAGPGDPGLITVRGLELLARADVVLHDALSHPALLAACRADAEVRNVGKRGGRVSPSQDWITDQLIERARAGKRVVRLKGGDSFLFARGAEEAEALAAAGIPFEVVPGISSPVGTAAYAGIPLTHRDLSSSVTFITGTDRAGVAWSPEAWKRLATATETICVLMGMRRIGEITEAIVSGGRSPETPAAVITWGARPEQRVLTATLGTIADRAARAGVQNPAVIVIGEVVTLRDKLRWYDNRPLFGRRVLIPRPVDQAAGTAQALFERGAAPVVFPVIEIVEPPEPDALEAAVRGLSRYDWVLFTSANGVTRTFAVLDRCGLDARAFGAARIGVIGPKTAEALGARGLRADVVAREFTGEGLAEAVATAKPGRVLLLRARVARDALPEMLRQRGANVDIAAAYETRPVAPARAAELARRLEEGTVDVVLFTSSSTVSSVVELLGPRAAEYLARVTVASIGPVTSETARQLGIAVDVTASTYTVEGVLDALERHFEGTHAT